MSRCLFVAKVVSLPLDYCSMAHDWLYCSILRPSAPRQQRVAAARLGRGWGLHLGAPRAPVLRRRGEGKISFLARGINHTLSPKILTQSTEWGSLARDKSRRRVASRGGADHGRPSARLNRAARASSSHGAPAARRRRAGGARPWRGGDAARAPPSCREPLCRRSARAWRQRRQ